MMTGLDIHLAGDAEKIEAFRNVHDVWSAGRSLEDHLRWRLASVQHNRAEWFVGTCDGRVVVSLGRYPVEFRCRGNVVPGIAIGAVHCLAEFRGRGFAPQLMRAVERLSAEQGIAISMLYSDIKPEYYAGLGYVECPAWETEIEPQSIAVKDPLAFRRGSLRNDVALLQQLDHEFHATLPLAIHRGDDYWKYLTRKSPDDGVFFVEEPAGTTVGYFRAAISQTEFTLRDFAVRPNTVSIAALFQTIVRAAAETECPTLGGWIPGTLRELSFLNPRKRELEITMVKPLRDGLTLTADERNAADFFHEIDHV